MHSFLYHYKVAPVYLVKYNLNIVWTTPPKAHPFVTLPLQSGLSPEDLVSLNQELMEIVRTVRVLLPQFAEALNNLCDSGNYLNPNLTSADEVCLKYSDTITEKLDRGRLIERELIRNNPRFKSKILEELQMLKVLNSKW